jgi:hypothetical protein
MSRTAKAILGIAAAAVLLGYMVYLTISTNVVSCEVCVEFRGRTECRRASGKDRAEAQMTAASTACSLISGGIDDGIACRNTPPVSATCEDR